MVSDVFPSVCPTHNRTHPDASRMQHFQQSKHVDILKSIQMDPSLQTYPDALTICDAFRCVQNATFSGITTLFDTKTRSDASCHCMRRNAFENLQKLFKNITLYFTIDSFLLFHDIPISTKQLTNLLNGLQQTRFDHDTYCIDNIALTVKPYIHTYSFSLIFIIVWLCIHVKKSYFITNY